MNIHKNFKITDKRVIVGIDEAGRGPAIGPLVYAAVIIPEDTKINSKVKDSKELSPSTRKTIFNDLIKDVSYVYVIIPADYITTKMHTGEENLNQLSMDAVTKLLDEIVKGFSSIGNVYIDALGNSSTYERILSQKHRLNYIIETNADKKYQIVSAASIIAKYTRDSKIKEIGYIVGSGYPSDPVTKDFLLNSFHPLFGYSCEVRYTWKTVENILGSRKSKGYKGGLNGFFRHSD